MHRHIGNQRAAGNIARHIAPEQCAPQRRTRQFDDVEALAAERNADDLEVLALARQVELQRGTLGGKERFFPGVVDRSGLAAGLFDVFVVVVLSLTQLLHPGGDLRVIIGDAARLPRDRGDLPRQRRFDGAHGNRQARAFARLDNAKARGEFHQRRCGSELDCERESFGIRQRPARQVLDPRGKQQLAFAVGGERSGKIEIG